MNKKPILIIASEFIPYSVSFGSVARVLTLAKYLDEKGFAVNLIASKGNKEISFWGYHEIMNQIKVSYVERKQLFFFKNNLGRKVNNLIKRIFADFYLPDTPRSFYNRFVKVALRLIRDEGIDIIYSSSPSFISAKVGLAIKEVYLDRVTWVNEYRDSWNCSKIFRKKLLINRCFSEKLELKSLKTCDYFVYVSPLIKSKIEKKYSLSINRKSLLVFNGYLRMPEIKTRKHYRKIQIGYFGIYNDKKHSYRNIEPLLRVVLESKHLCEEIEFHLYGKSDMKKMYEGKYNCFNFYNPIKHEEALNKMQEMDYLLLIHTDDKTSDEVITGKFFDYIAAQRPILALSHKNMEAVKMIEEYKLGVHIDIENIKDDFERLVINHPYELNYNRSLEKFSRKLQYTKILEIISPEP